MSDEAWRLIRLLIREPDKRLGKNGFNEIKRYRFFADVDWDHLLEEEPPFIPELEGETDVSYFVNEDEEDDSASVTQPHDERGSAYQQDSNFLGFTYKGFAN